MSGTPDRPAMLERLRRSNRDRPGALVGSLAHDFNNVLSTISGYAELARADLEPGSDAHAHLTEVLRACARGAELTARAMPDARSA